MATTEMAAGRWWPPPGGSDQDEAVNMDSDASYAGEVERDVRGDNDFSLCGKLHQTRQRVLGQFPATGSPPGVIEPLS
jgi:hypothetical protein